MNKRTEYDPLGYAPFLIFCIFVVYSDHNNRLMKERLYLSLQKKVGCKFGVKHHNTA